MVCRDANELLRERISQSLVEQLEFASIDWTMLQKLHNPVLRIEACLQDGPAEKVRQSTPGLIVSHLVDLSGIASPDLRSIQQEAQHESEELLLFTDTPDSSLTLPPLQTITAAVEEESIRQGEVLELPSTPNSELAVDTTSDRSRSVVGQRRNRGGLRPVRSDSLVAEPEEETQRRIHSDDKFPKRRKKQPIGHFLQPSTLDKLIGGIWEQIHGSLNLDPQSLYEQLQLQALNHDDSDKSNASGSLAPVSSGSTAVVDRNVFSNGNFSRNNMFCRQVTQASRACRSLEVIVQARWIEHFDAYVDSWAAANPTVSRTKYNKAVIMKACADFSWSEKELRNKMYIWRGYKEIKDAGGWAALVFSGFGIYRFCKYRIGFDKDSMQRLGNMRPALEVAADTLHPRWRQLLTVVGDSSQRVFDGHAHDWVVFLDGSYPVPLSTTYLQWDPNFSYRQIEEPVVDEVAWGCDDPRWTPPSDVTVGAASMPICETCGKDQSDEPQRNCCYCFPTLFGCVRVSPSPVLVFRTPNGRNNGLLAVCAFERGAPVGEFVGVVTKGLQYVDVMESSTASGSYQIWQGKQGNFTRFVNHSCKANAQYQRFTWLNTQRVILVSKGIEAGAEITVDYSDKYWRGLEKDCLCGESCCRYRKNDDGPPTRSDSSNSSTSSH